MPNLGDLFGKGSAAEQLFVWNVLGQIITALIGPGVDALTQQVNDIAPTAQLPPAQLAEGVIRGFLDPKSAADSARRAGLENDKFDTMKLLAESGPAVADAIRAWRLGLIGDGSPGPAEVNLQAALAEAGLNPKWADVVKKLSLIRPTPGAILNAYLEGQIGEADARDAYGKLGGDPEYFDLLYNSEGQAPTPVEALELANRGIIKWDGTGPESTSYEQAFLEGPWRNKWLAPFKALGEYLPPPRTVTAMFKEGSIDQATAIDLLQKQGLTPQLAAAYVSSGASQKTATEKDLAKSDVLALYAGGIITAADATTMLAALGYNAAESAFILQLQDLRRSIAAVNTAVSRVHTLYVGHKISKTVAVSVLNQLQVPTDQVNEIIATWDLEASVNVRLPTESQIASAFKYEIIDQATAQQLLIEQGYQPHDAWLVLSVSNKAPLPNEPSADVSPVTGTP